MKTKEQIERKLQDVEAHILNMAEAACTAENKEDRIIYELAEQMAISQAEVLKWVLQ